MRRILFENDDTFWEQTNRCLSHATAGGADSGEVITTASRIPDGDFEAWYNEWLRLADRIAGGADRSLAGGHRVSARNASLRASNYYRQAHFVLHAEATGPRVTHAAERSIAYFEQAASLFDPVIEAVEIPYEDTTLPGYWYPARYGSGPRPTIIMHGGFDSTAEEQHFWSATAAWDRGYNVLSFEGPGQGKVILRQGIPFRHDWENVIGPVVDWLVERPDVDAGKIGYTGLSLGGYLAPRAAAFESRIAAVVAHDGLYDFGTVIGNVVEALGAHAEDGETGADVFARTGQGRWAVPHGMWVMGAGSPQEFVEKVGEFSLAGGVAEKIDCPILVVEDQAPLFVGQARTLFDHLTTQNKTYLAFGEDEGAGAHCHAGALFLANARIYDWLDDVLDHRA
ncbi:hypothetical protein BJF85_18840 [Saccharomonospora sp. CUA-673]|uniref:alpha/beta hydrolase family protein n=1 Tax=Saccharomonospora sp. CUA-673 TaxID=1904969 RepID=UPI000965DBEC|nr:alpha/beta hydrolase [Saccharomonospora sp. CUA-673]OLT45433.1 hypothetical protein BJF85_18840 [Saccharomonospora sp. CUA-673]